jgi:hypothetical protein
MRKTFVPHVPQVPFTARIPFFMVTSFASLIGTCFLHFIQRPSAMDITLQEFYRVEKRWYFYKALVFQ